MEEYVMNDHRMQSIRRLAELYTAAWCGQEPSRVASFYEEKGSLSVNGGVPAVGRQAIAEVARSFMIDFPDMVVHFDDVVIEGNGALYHWTLTGTNTGPGGTGKPVRISGFEVWEIGPNGLIANSNGHFDSEDYRRQLAS